MFKSNFVTFTTIILLLSCSKKTETESNYNSIEKAIIVNSVREEYDFIKKQCSDCTFNSQSLIFKNGKKYDKIQYIKSNGEKISYYFDISSFYEKK